MMTCPSVSALGRIRCGRARNGRQLHDARSPRPMLVQRASNVTIVVTEP